MLGLNVVEDLSELLAGIDACNVARFCESTTRTEWLVGVGAGASLAQITCCRCTSSKQNSLGTATTTGMMPNYSRFALSSGSGKIKNNS
jgi:hypothetical protein